MLLLYTVVKLQEPKRMQLLAKVFTSRGSLVDLFAFDSNLLNWFNTILSLFFFLGLGLLVFRYANLLELWPWEVLSEPQQYLIIVAVLVSFNLLRKMVGYMIGYLVEEYRRTKKYFLLKQLYMQWIGLLLFPLLVLEYYSPFQGLNLVYYLLVFYALLQLYSYIRIAYIFLFEFRLFRYHLFVYLCALEILPLLVGVKFVLDWLN